MTGPLPDTWRNLTRLERNALTGTIPSALGNLATHGAESTTDRADRVAPDQPHQPVGHVPVLRDPSPYVDQLAVARSASATVDQRDHGAAQPCIRSAARWQQSHRPTASGFVRSWPSLEAFQLAAHLVYLGRRHPMHLR